MSWRVARSLLTLRDQIDEAFPDRDKASDGTIGDADHRTRDSDHNPWCDDDVVTALDITHDPEHGVDIDQLTDELQASRDPRIKYVIANGLIMSGDPGPSPWVWRDYDGSNEHTRHFHLSVICGTGMDDTRPWQLPSLQEDDDMALTDEDADRIVDALVRREIARWYPGDKNTEDTLSLGMTWNQSRGWSQDSALRLRRLERAIAAMAESLPTDVREAVRAELADVVDDGGLAIEGTVDVTIGGGDQA